MAARGVPVVWLLVLTYILVSTLALIYLHHTNSLVGERAITKEDEGAPERVMPTTPMFDQRASSTSSGEFSTENVQTESHKIELFTEFYFMDWKKLERTREHFNPSHNDVLTSYRQKELFEVLQYNLNLDFVSRINVFLHANHTDRIKEFKYLKNSSKLKVIHLRDQLKFSDLFERARKMGKNKLCIFIHVDNYLSTAWKRLKNLNPKFMLGGARVETFELCHIPTLLEQEGNCHELHKDGSFDVVVFNSSSITPEVVQVTNFYTNHWGMEAMLTSALSKFVTFRDPCLELPIYHHHCSGVRLHQRPFLGGNPYVSNAYVAGQELGWMLLERDSFTPNENHTLRMYLQDDPLNPHPIIYH